MWGWCNKEGKRWKRSWEKMPRMDNFPSTNWRPITPSSPSRNHLKTSIQSNHSSCTSYAQYKFSSITSNSRFFIEIISEQNLSTDIGCLECVFFCVLDSAVLVSSEMPISMQLLSISVSSWLEMLSPLVLSSLYFLPTLPSLLLPFDRRQHRHRHRHPQHHSWHRHDLPSLVNLFLGDLSSLEVLSLPLRYLSPPMSFSVSLVFLSISSWPHSNHLRFRLLRWHLPLLSLRVQISLMWILF